MYRRQIVIVVFALVFFSTIHAQQPSTTPGAATATVEVGSSAVPATPPSAVKPDQPAVPTTNVPSPAEPSNAPEQVKWALGVMFFYEWLKKSKWFPWIHDNLTSRAQAWIGFLFALVTAVGINITIHGSIFDASGADITFAHVSFTAIKDVAFQWISQQGWYTLLMKQGTVPAAASTRNA